MLSLIVCCSSPGEYRSPNNESSSASRAPIAYCLYSGVRAPKISARVVLTFFCSVSTRGSQRSWTPVVLKFRSSLTRHLTLSIAFSSAALSWPMAECDAGFPVDMQAPNVTASDFNSSLAGWHAGKEGRESTPLNTGSSTMSAAAASSEMAFFSVLARSGSFSAAARELGVTTPAVSKRLAHLEARLGVPLMTRTTRRVGVTPEGEIYLSEARRILAEIDDMERLVTSAVAAPKGLLRVNATLGFGRSHLAPLIAQFSRAHPEVQVQL